MHEVKTIVLDETDHLLTPEHRGTIQSIIKSTLRDRQLLCFSATLKDDAERELREMTKDAEVLKIKRSKEESAKVKHQFLVCDQRDKVKILQKFSRLPGMQALVFVKDIGNLNVYAEKLKFHHVEIGVLHSEAKKLSAPKYCRHLRRESSHCFSRPISQRAGSTSKISLMSSTPICQTLKAISTGREGREERGMKEP